MTINQILNWAIKKLKKHAIKSANLDAEVLLMELIQKDKVFLYSHSEHKLTKTQENKFKKYIWQRAKGMPVVYLIGHKEFYGLDFLVNKNVLIPRPATEILVEESINIIKKIKNKKIIMIDVGTGSGCISISVLNNFRPLSRQRFLSVYATDISSLALKLAQQNAKNHQVYNKIKFIKSDLLNYFIKVTEKISDRNKVTTLTSDFICHNLIITANLPYLTSAQYKANLDLEFEPRQALLGGKDGLKYYKKILNQLKLLKKRCSLSITLLIEIDPLQAIPLQKFIKKLFPKSSIKFSKDLAGKNRVVIIKI